MYRGEYRIGANEYREAIYIFRKRKICFPRNKSLDSQVTCSNRYTLSGIPKFEIFLRVI